MWGDTQPRGRPAEGSATALQARDRALTAEGRASGLDLLPRGPGSTLGGIGGLLGAGCYPRASTTAPGSLWGARAAEEWGCGPIGPGSTRPLSPGARRPASGLAAGTWACVGSSSACWRLRPFRSALLCPRTGPASMWGCPWLPALLCPQHRPVPATGGPGRGSGPFSSFDARWPLGRFPGLSWFSLHTYCSLLGSLHTSCSLVSRSPPTPGARAEPAPDTPSAWEEQTPPGLGSVTCAESSAVLTLPLPPRETAHDRVRQSHLWGSRG